MNDIIIKERIAKYSDLYDILTLMSDAKLQMNKLGIQQWTDDYPNRDIIINDICCKHAYVIGENCDASFCVEENNGVIELKRLMVRSNCTNQGLAKGILRRTIDIAFTKNINEIFITTNKNNFPMINLLSKFNFIKVNESLKKGREQFGVFYEYYLHLNC